MNKTYLLITILTIAVFSACNSSEKSDSASAAGLNGKVYITEMSMMNDNPIPRLNDTLYFDADSLLSIKSSGSQFYKTPYSYTLLNDTIMWTCAMKYELSEATMNWDGKMHGDQIQGRVHMMDGDRIIWEYKFVGTLIE